MLGKATDAFMHGEIGSLEYLEVLLEVSTDRASSSKPVSFPALSETVCEAEELGRLPVIIKTITADIDKIAEEIVEYKITEGSRLAVRKMLRGLLRGKYGIKDAYIVDAAYAYIACYFAVDAVEYERSRHEED